MATKHVSKTKSGKSSSTSAAKSMPMGGTAKGPMGHKTQPQSSGKSGCA